MNNSEPRGTITPTVRVRAQEFTPGGKACRIEVEGRAIILRVRDNSLSRRKWSRFVALQTSDGAASLAQEPVTIIDIEDGTYLVIGTYLALSAITGYGTDPKPWVQDWSYVLATDAERIDRELAKRDGRARKPA